MDIFLPLMLVLMECQNTPFFSYFLYRKVTSADFQLVTFGRYNTGTKTLKTHENLHEIERKC